MQIKLLEIHDDGRSIIVAAIKIQPATDRQRELLIRRTGFDPNGSSVVMIELDGHHATANPYEWIRIGFHPRTMPTVHQHVVHHFDQLEDGEIIDVRALTGGQIDPGAEQFDGERPPSDDNADDD